MRSFAGSLADGVQADAILIPSHPPIPPTNIRKVRVVKTVKKLKMPVSTSLHHCLKNNQLKLNGFSGKDPAKGVFSIMHSYLESFDIPI